MILTWALQDRLGQTLFRVSTIDTDAHTGILPDAGTLRCTIPRLPLVPGIYDLRFELRIGSTVLDYMHDAFLLIVFEGDFYGSETSQQ